MSYASNAATALRLITKKGKTVTLTKLTGAVTATPKACQFSYSLNAIDGDRVRAGDCYILVAATDTALVGKDLKTFTFATVGGREWGIEDVNELIPGDTSLVFKLQLRSQGRAQA